MATTFTLWMLLQVSIKFLKGQEINWRLNAHIGGYLNWRVVWGWNLIVGTRFGYIGVWFGLNAWCIVNNMKVWDYFHLFFHFNCCISPWIHVLLFAPCLGSYEYMNAWIDICYSCLNFGLFKWLFFISKCCRILIAPKATI